MGRSKLEEETAVRLAKAWYDTDRRSPGRGAVSMVVPPVGAYRNNGGEWSILYRVEPDGGSNTTYLYRFRFNATGTQWRVAGATEDGACMHSDDEASQPPPLDETAAVKAAKRWYDTRFFGGAYTMGAPLNAYCNKAHGSQRHWSLRYHAEGPEVDPSTAFFVLWKYAAEKSSKGWRWRVVSLDLAAASETVDETPAAEPAAASAASAKPAGDPQAKRPRLTVGKSSAPDGAKSAADPQAKRPRLKVGSTSSTPGSAPQGVAQLGEEAAIRAAQRWYQREHSAELKPLKIFRNSEREYSILYCTEPNLSGNTYLRRYKFAPPPSDGTGEWTVRSRPFEDDAALHEDGKDPTPAELDRETAAKAASRWYNKYFSGGGNRMDSPVIAAYGNTERDLEVTEGREWSLRCKFARRLSTD